MGAIYILCACNCGKAIDKDNCILGKDDLYYIDIKHEEEGIQKNRAHVERAIALEESWDDEDGMGNSSIDLGSM